VDCFVASLLAMTVQIIRASYFAATIVAVASAGKLANSACSVVMVE
jgi:hypothetical protein